MFAPSLSPFDLRRNVAAIAVDSSFSLPFVEQGRHRQNLLLHCASLLLYRQVSIFCASAIPFPFVSRHNKMWTLGQSMATRTGNSAHTRLL